MLLRQRTPDESVSECCEKSREKVPDTVWTQSMKGRTKETEYQYEKRAGGLTLWHVRKQMS